MNWYKRIPPIQISLCWKQPHAGCLCNIRFCHFQLQARDPDIFGEPEVEMSRLAYHTVRDLVQIIKWKQELYEKIPISGIIKWKQPKQSNSACVKGLSWNALLYTLPFLMGKFRYDMLLQCVAVCCSVSQQSRPFGVNSGPFWVSFECAILSVGSFWDCKRTCDAEVCDTHTHTHPPVNTHTRTQTHTHTSAMWQIAPAALSSFHL